MARPARVQITRDQRKDRSTTFGLRVRMGGADERAALGNTLEGWDEVRAEAARRQLLAKIELGQWAPRPAHAPATHDEEEPRLLDELTAYRRRRQPAAMDAPAFPTRTGTRRDRSNILTRVVQPVLGRANELRDRRHEPPILVHVTPHTFRRTYISLLVAAGYDLPYVQAQVGHRDPSTTLATYAQAMARQDRDELRSEILQLLGANRQVTGHERDAPSVAKRRREQPLRAAEKAGKGRAPHL